MTKLSIQEVFDIDPLDLTHENTDDLIEYYRARRAQFASGRKDAGSTKLIVETINLEDLGL